MTALFKNLFNTPPPELSPVYINDGLRIYWIEENSPSIERLLIKMRKENEKRETTLSTEELNIRL